MGIATLGRKRYGGKYCQSYQVQAKVCGVRTTVLENKLGLIDSLDLAKSEEKISKEKAKRLFEENSLADKKAGRFETLSFIHQFLFEDIYDFAGKIRMVNIAKGGFRFAPLMYLHS